MTASTRSSRLEALLFEQGAVPWRLARLRIALGAVVSALLFWGPFGRFFADEAWLYAPGGVFFWLPALSAHQLGALRIVTLIAALFTTAGYCTQVASWTTALGFFALNGYTARFALPLFNYDTHLNLFLVLLAASDSARVYSIDALRRPAQVDPRDPRGSFALGFMQLYVALLYCQAFFAKLLLSGPGWFVDGRVILVQTLRMGTGFGRWLCQWPSVFRGIGLATGALELCVGFGLLAGGRARTVAALSAIGFHVGTWLVLGISFWHLALLIPPLFLLRSGAPQTLASPARLTRVILDKPLP